MFPSIVETVMNNWALDLRRLIEREIPPDHAPRSP